jgi:hypothetical protein
MLDCSAAGVVVAADRVDAAADDGVPSFSNTGHSALSEPVAGGAVLAGSDDGTGEETSGGEGAGEATFGFSLIHPPEVSPKKAATVRGSKHVYPSISGSHDRPRSAPMTAFSAWWSLVGPERPPLGVIDGGKNAGWMQVRLGRMEWIV